MTGLAFDALISPKSQTGSSLTFELPADWHQGRGLYGGLVVAVLVRAMEQVVGLERPLRSVTSELCGPTQPGQATVVVETLRAGSAVSTVTARLVQGGEVQAHAVGVFGKPRGDARVLTTLPTPAMPDWRGIEPIEIAAPIGPEFSQHFEYRIIDGIPLSGASEPRNTCFFRLRNAGARPDAAWVAAHADASWPAFLAMEEAMRPIATIAYTLQLIAPLDGLDPAVPLFYRGTDVSIREGFVVEFRELWSPDGQLVALNQQTIAIIR